MNILIVEDEKELNDFLKNGFEQEDFKVDTALDGEKGYNLALASNYDTIILDNVLPKKEGKEVCRDLRREGCVSPILILSVRSEVDDKVDLLNIGADDYMTKPFSFEELLARVKALARRPAQLEGDILRVGDLTLDLVNQTAKCKGKNIMLTRKEFSILACLAKNKGKTLNRNEIMKHVWDEYVDPFSNTLEAHIVQIRKKISPAGKKANIQTVTGIGYRFGQRED